MAVGKVNVLGGGLKDGTVIPNSMIGRRTPTISLESVNPIPLFMDEECILLCGDPANTNTLYEYNIRTGITSRVINASEQVVAACMDVEYYYVLSYGFLWKISKHDKSIIWKYSLSSRALNQSYGASNIWLDDEGNVCVWYTAPTNNLCTFDKIDANGESIKLGTNFFTKGTNADQAYIDLKNEFLYVISSIGQLHKYDYNCELIASLDVSTYRNVVSVNNNIAIISAQSDKIRFIDVLDGTIIHSITLPMGAYQYAITYDHKRDSLYIGNGDSSTKVFSKYTDGELSYTDRYTGSEIYNRAMTTFRKLMYNQYSGGIYGDFGMYQNTLYNRSEVGLACMYDISIIRK